MFDWDKNKARINQEKHLVSFRDAIQVFKDKHRITQLDKRFDYGEQRFITIAKIEKRIFVVVYTVRKSVIRIISARKANNGT